MNSIKDVELVSEFICSDYQFCTPIKSIIPKTGYVIDGYIATKINKNNGFSFIGINGEKFGGLYEFISDKRLGDVGTTINLSFDENYEYNYVIIGVSYNVSHNVFVTYLTFKGTNHFKNGYICTTCKQWLQYSDKYCKTCGKELKDKPQFSIRIS
jgi:hypothetical protein